jgi:putative protease
LEPPYEKIGRITHFFPKIEVAIIELTTTVKNGENIVVRGSTTDIEQTIESMEVNHNKISTAAAGQLVGLKVLGQAKENDIVYRIRTS